MIPKIVFSLAITHLPGNSPERDASFGALIEALGVDQFRSFHGGASMNPEGPACYRVFFEKAPNHVWSGQMWRWAAEETHPDVTHCLFLQDDVEICPDFWAVLNALVQAQPDMIIGLQTVHPLAGILAREGLRWISTSDGLVGVGYVVPRPLLREFLEWRATQIKPGALESTIPDGRPGLSEDTCLGLFALTTGKRIAHPIPTPIDHAAHIVSTYGNDGAPARKSQVTWRSLPASGQPAPWAGQDMTSAEFWRAPIRHVGRQYDLSPWMAHQHVLGITPTRIQAMRADNSRREIMQINARRRASGRPASTRILLATPLRGTATSYYYQSVWSLLRDEELELVDPWELSDVLLWQEDLVRVRSRFVAHFLQETDATHLLFVDADIAFLPKVVRGMLQAMTPQQGEVKHMVAVPYPRRDEIHFDRVRASTELTPEGAAYRYSVRPLSGSTQLSVGADACVEVEGIGLGCCLLSRDLLQAMSDYYAEDPLDYKQLARDFAAECGRTPESAQDGLLFEGSELESWAQFIARAARERPPLFFEDQLPGLHGCKSPTTALFQLMLRDQGLLSEDYSFCQRVRDFGQKVWMYLGDGSPVNHVGEWVFRGDLGGFGLRRG